MISEKKLRYYAHIADSAENEHVQCVIRQLVDEVVRLEREADWLALRMSEQLGPIYYGCNCADCTNNLKSDHTLCVKCWREAARKAVNND